jgi:hypothetical protein
MYISIENKKNRKIEKGTSCYVYLCESKRIDGKVKTSKKYIFKFEETDLSSVMRSQKVIISFTFHVKLKISDTQIIDSLQKDFLNKLNKIHAELMKDEYWRSFWEMETESYKEQNIRNNNFITTQLNEKDELKKELVKAGFKQLSKKYHPDVGGTEEKMKLLNEVYRELVNDNVITNL